jgi:HlyD family secretion protein
LNKISSIAEPHKDSGISISGAGMDRVVKKRTPPGRMVGYALAGIAALIFIWWLVTALLGGRSLSVNAQRVVASAVTTGTFEDFIPLRGRLVPRSTVYLDAIEGGRVEKVLVEDGALVSAGESIAILSNTSLQLEVLGREAAVAEQLNNMRTIELQLEQNRLSHKRNLVEIDYQIIRLQRSIARQQDLASKDLVAQSTVDELQDELTYFKNRRDVTLESQASDTRLQDQQLKQLRESNEQLLTSLTFARQNLDDLNMRAPLDGQLSGFDIEIGQSIDRGGRIGQIDDPDRYKLNAKIDEYYLGRIDLKQVGVANHNGRDFAVEIAKIYPQVNNGQFEVDMTFAEEPLDVRRGQTLQLELTLGDNSDAILIPNGTFYQETGGNWVFVVSPDGTEAVRRSVRLGRRNVDFIEVLDGLEPGEQVITSPYTSYVGMDRLTLD